MSGRSVLVAFDKERHLRFDANALCDLEGALGLSLGELFLRPGAIGISTIRAALWAGLKHEDPGLTLSGTGTIIQAFLDAGGRFQVLGDKIREALELAGFAGGKPKDASDETAPAGPFVSGTGSTPPSP